MQSIQNLRHSEPLPQELKVCLPCYLTDAIERCGAPQIEEIRLHSNRYTTITYKGKIYSTRVSLSKQEMADILKRMCKGSLYAYSQNINQGYLTLNGGIRVGVCGKAAVEKGQVIGVSEISGLIVRIPHRLPISATPVLEQLKKHRFLQGVLIFSSPGVGKTTLLRATAEAASSPACGIRTVVVDTREEFFQTLKGESLYLDILVGYPRQIGIEIAVRSLGAQLILCDEIGNAADAEAILTAANCGVPLIASAHASNVSEVLSRPALLKLHQAHVFGAYMGITRSETACEFQYQTIEWEEAQKRLLASHQSGKEYS